jgi:hypothetical protein
MQTKKVIIICFLVFCSIIIFNIILSNYFEQEKFSGSDFEHHYKMAKFGRTISNGIDVPDINYPIFLSDISFLFTQNLLSYYSFFAFIIFFLIPIALFFLALLVLLFLMFCVLILVCRRKILN